MNFVKVVLGFVPTIAFSVLAPHLGAGWAAGAGLLAAVIVTATTRRGGINPLSMAQAVVLLAMAVSGLAGGPRVDQALVRLGPSVAGLLLGTFMITTATRFPFSAQIARQRVSRQYWHSARFLEVNRRISTAWGCAVLASGALGLIAASLALRPDGHGVLLVRIVLGWVLPILGFYLAARYSRRAADHASAVAQAAQGPQTHGGDQADGADQPPRSRTASR